MTTKELQEQIKSLYDDFFNDLKIDKRTGIVNGTDKRFSGFPYIGTNYVIAPIKILFIALDTGEDELKDENTYYDFDGRRSVIDGPNLDFNSHIAGLYATTLYFLKNVLGEESAWDALWKCRDKYKNAKAIKSVSDLLPKDLLKYVAYDNRYRFVTVGRYNERGGGKDRIWINAKRELELLMAEIGVLSPDIIVFQGTTGLWNCNVDVLKQKYQVVVAYHPSYWQQGADKLQYIVDQIGPQIKLQ